MKAAEAATATKQAETEVEHQAALLAELERYRVRIHSHLQVPGITHSCTLTGPQVALVQHLLGLVFQHSRRRQHKSASV